MNSYKLYCDDCVNWLKNSPHQWDAMFCDPPDNIGLNYGNYKDKLPDNDYIDLLHKWLNLFVNHAQYVWFSYNAKYWAHVGHIITELQDHYGPNFEVKPCVQIYTFGQHNQRDLGGNHRPLLRIKWHDAPLYPDAIRTPSWRQEHGDKRADPRGRVPGDVFNITRVTGNSKQRRKWHPTQLNEGLVERCLKLTTVPGDTVLDPFAGTGTTLRVCKAINRNCTLLEIDHFYCEKIAEEHELTEKSKGIWSNDI